MLPTRLTLSLAGKAQRAPPPPHILLPSHPPYPSTHLPLSFLLYPFQPPPLPFPTFLYFLLPTCSPPLSPPHPPTAFPPFLRSSTPPLHPTLPPPPLPLPRSFLSPLGFSLFFSYTPILRPYLGLGIIPSSASLAPFFFPYVLSSRLEPRGSSRLTRVKGREPFSAWC